MAWIMAKTKIICRFLLKSLHFKIIFLENLLIFKFFFGLEVFDKFRPSREPRSGSFLPGQGLMIPLIAHGRAVPKKNQFSSLLECLSSKH